MRNSKLQALLLSAPFGFTIPSGHSKNDLTVADIPAAKQLLAHGVTFAGIKVQSLKIATDGVMTTLTDQNGVVRGYNADDLETAARAYVIQRATAAGITEFPTWLTGAAMPA